MNKVLYLILFVLICSTSYADKLESANALLKNSNRGLEFIENKGQIADQNGNVNLNVLFIAETDGGTIAIRKDGISFTFIKTEQELPDTKFQNNRVPWHDKKFKEPVPTKMDLYRVDMKLNNSLVPSNISKKEVTEDYNNYYLAHCPDGITNVRKFKTVTLENVYQGIDLVLYTNDESKFQYDFVVKQNANPDKINFVFEGADKVEIGKAGELIVKTPFGNIEQKAPFSYQPSNLKHYINSRTIMSDAKIIKSKFIINKDNSISFDLLEYNKQLPVVIDPLTRIWGTYYGGSGRDNCGSIATDKFRNIFLNGMTYSTTLISTIGAHQSNIGGSCDVFLVKFDSSGGRQWCTYYGGEGLEIYGKITIDSKGNIYMPGCTGSKEVIATTNAYKTFINDNDYDAFLVKFNPDGIRLWGTYYGGKRWSNVGDYGRAVAVDPYDNVYMTGETGAKDFISSTFAHQPIYGGGDEDAYLVKFDKNGNKLWETYYGGESSDGGYSVVTDQFSNVYVSGDTESKNGIATLGSHKMYHSNSNDAFLVKFDSSGKRIWGTYFGGSENDIAMGLDIDRENNMYIVGRTSSSSSISTIGAHQETQGNNFDGFLAKFNTDGLLLWGTYFGGEDYDYVKDVSVNNFGGIYICGFTRSKTLISTSQGYRENLLGPEDAFLAKFNINGKRLWGTYYGGSRNETSYSVATDSVGNIFLAGETESSDFISSSDSHQSEYNQEIDPFLVKFNDSNVNSIIFNRDLDSCENIVKLNFNPISNLIEFQSIKELEIYSLKLYDLNGNEFNLKYQNLDNYNYRFELGSELVSGLYSLIINTNFQVLYYKFIIFRK